MPVDESHQYSIKVSQYDHALELPIMEVVLENDSGARSKVQLPLPITINKFFAMQFIDQYQFANKWQSYKGFKYKNEPREVS